MSIIRRQFAVLAAALLSAGSLSGQERGTITGAVLEAATQRPLQGAQVAVAGTQIGTFTNQQGRFVLSNVPAGTHEIRSSLIGYGQATRAVNVVAGQTVNVDISLNETVVAID